MKRTTIFVPEALERDLQLHARREGKPAAAIVREAIEAYLVAHRPAGRLPSFAAVGASGRSDIARTHEALVFGDLDPHQGTPVPVRPAYHSRPTRARRARKTSTARR